MDRRRYLVAYTDIKIDVIADGQGAPLVLLPSSSRDSEDFDDVAERLAAAGFLVLRPQPRGMLGSVGPIVGITQHDLARDVAEVIRHANAGPAIVVGHAYGQWVGRTVAADFPALVRGVVLAAASARSSAPELAAALLRGANPALPTAERLAALQFAFFAPGHDPRPWLAGWHPAVTPMQRAATAATPRAQWWTAGRAPVLDIQAALDPWRPPGTENDFRDDLGAGRVSVIVIPDASHALFPEQPAALVDAILAWTGSTHRFLAPNQRRRYTAPFVRPVGIGGTSTRTLT